MELPSIETVSKATVYVYALVVAIAVVALVAFLVLRRASSRLREDQSPHLRSETSENVGSAAGDSDQTAGPLTTLSRVVLEYIGNENRWETLSSGARDRRRNRASRALMDHVRGQALARDASPSEVEQLVEELRQAIRSAERID